MKTDKNSDLNTKINDFLEYLEVEKGSSSLTLRNYRHYLGRLMNWLQAFKKTSDIADINPDNIRKYRLYLSRITDPKGATLSRRTQGYHAIAIRSLLRWLLKNDYQVLSPDKIELPKVSDRQIKFLNGEQVDRLLNAPSLSHINGKRDKAILEVLFSTGIRVSELTSLDRDKIDYERKEIGITGKGGKGRVVFLSTRALDWISEYLKVRADHFKPLFIRHRGKVDPSHGDDDVRLTPRSVQRMVKKYTQKVKLTVDVTPHVLRHSFATDLLVAGADIRSVQEMLGHKNIATTQVYIHVTNKHLREVHKSYHHKENS
ncbi:hypothetical protein A2382_03875 [Candidatus Woesebacteria bacterium RIFOXYB1_FULL_38_16]|uniref:Tyrosine recombinase XerC n=1 Tax=Candidatus Woesebacteria bacterium RIFOXYB1_FULL_38_16 TaxID=1802538 RepID=A0A1F8CV98_9BACT|nr:MAG: hypothetical protein A2382_03875 [Candidatus Woesebacteria bacterium RIFOXYB1_FULL_38_16]